MGLCGLALAWFRDAPLMGEAASAVVAVIAGLAALVFAVLAVATVLRARCHPEVWADDRRHPVQHTLVAALPLSLTLLAVTWLVVLVRVMGTLLAPEMVVSMQPVPAG